MPAIKNDFPSLQAKVPDPCVGCTLRRKCAENRLSCRAAAEWANAGNTKRQPGNPNPYWMAVGLAPDNASYMSAKTLAIRMDRKIAKALKNRAQRQALGDIARRLLA